MIASIWCHSFPLALEAKWKTYSAWYQPLTFLLLCLFDSFWPLVFPLEHFITLLFWMLSGCFLDAFLIFFALVHVIAFDELKTDFLRNQLINAVRWIHLSYLNMVSMFNLLFPVADEWVPIIFNLPLITYHIHGYMHPVKRWFLRFNYYNEC